ncbi:hypothetical protein E4U13_004227 [Claviceps humidiphila]|uniref:Uncharacterized protein n=1 Tax=Claviceps humidiphila TaxID=1294629 RepID=A0A9P7PWH3_9HYPO|nr:hypothetical protein E4U13_004227 [Claviceps humidiphila]
MPSQPLQPPAHLRELVQTRFAKALAVGDLHYYATQATLLRVGQVHFQLRFSPALAKKSAGKSQSSSSSPPSHSQSIRIVDPFAHPSPSLFLSDLGDAHYIVLNKFAVVSGHFILATRAFRPQNHVLEEADLEATMACIKAYGPGQLKEAGHQHDGLFAFFNSGEHSGASQPHRHLQFLPVDQMREGLGGSEESSWRVLASQGPEAEKQLPFRVFSEEIRLDMAASEVHGAYLRLYRRACRAVRLMREEKNKQNVNDGKNDSNAEADGSVDGTGTGACVDDVPEEGPALISYNLGLTSTRMVLCPRLAEGGPVLDHDGHEVGRLSLNGTLLAGTALVKNAAEWDTLRGQPSLLVDVLRRIGIPKD